MEIKLGSIIKWAYPDAVPTEDYVIQDDGSGPYIKEWNLEQEKPSEETIKRLARKYSESKDEEMEQVKKRRKSAYPDISDQLDAILKYLETKEDLEGTELKSIINKCKQVKLNNPKPEIK